MIDLSPVADRLQADVDDGLFTAGAQVTITRGDETLLELALGTDGLGRPTTAETRFRVYCTGKPLTALAVGLLVDDGHLEFDEELEDLLPAYRSLRGGTTLRQVMNHTAGLHLPDGRAVELTPPPLRRRLLEQQERPVGWQLGRQAAYSEHLAWHLLGAAIEAVTGDDLRDHLATTVLGPLGLESTTIGMTPAQLAALAPVLGVNLDLRALKAYPMLFERTERVATEVNPGHGTVTTAGDLARLYRGVLASRRGAQVAGVPGTGVLAEMTTDARPRLEDLVLRRPCSMGLGFMTSLEDHEFGSRVSATAFGHSGNVGSSFAFADPEHDLVVAVVFNGIVDPDSAFWRRRGLVDAIYAALDAEEAPGSDDHVVGEAGEAEDLAPHEGRTSRWRRRRQG